MTADGLTLRTEGEGVRLVLIRHGQTPSNVRFELDTVPPGPGLTEEGGRQADDLADRLAGEKIVSVRASRALRAQQTAEPLATVHGLPVDVLDGIQEIYVGDLEGSAETSARMRFEEINRRWHRGELDEPMPGGEAGREALERFLAAAQAALEGIDAGAVVLVSHGAMLRLVGSYLAPDVEGIRLANTGVVTLEPADTTTGWRCVQWDGLELS